MLCDVEICVYFQSAGGNSLPKPLSPKDTNSLTSARAPAAKKPARPALPSQAAEKVIADDDDAGLQVRGPAWIYSLPWSNAEVEIR